MRVLTLFCGSFGSGYGYLLGGATEVVGIDRMKRDGHPEGVTFIKADVRDVLTDTGFIASFDLVDASPPCKSFTRLQHMVKARGVEPADGDLLTPTRAALEAAGVPYVLENVEGAPMRPDVMLCGSMFGLHTHDEHGRRRWLKRHRWFELGGWGNYGWGLQAECQHPEDDPPLGVYGRTTGDLIPGGGQVADKRQAQELLEMPWASWGGLTQAIPPAYTRYLMRSFIAEREGTTSWP